MLVYNKQFISNFCFILIIFFGGRGKIYNVYNKLKTKHDWGVGHGCLSIILWQGG
jgi:hypothetical protein